ncbi:MAG: hypothetical protein Homavirus5_11 [Homavirus sp.]|uniref:Uncharacterized protein n=1 Tax=Homavirus sp. TaxID=2487769 RepID=A0A3G5A9P5_9VIRU|nr:MAG: hypothetical protein Homavirus5_11 [Homavirus sp.]
MSSKNTDKDIDTNIDIDIDNSSDSRDSRDSTNSSDSDDSDHSKSIDKEAEQLRISKEFQENVIKYIKLDDLIRKKEKEMKELKNQKKPCEEFILKYLDKVGENIIEVTGGKLIKNKSETKAPLSQDIIKEAISDKILDPKKVEEIIALMDTLRPKSARVNLKRTSVRGTKSSNKTTGKKD